MNRLNQLCSALALSAVLLSACNSSAQPQTESSGKEITTPKVALTSTGKDQPKKGERVANQDVCMVNDAYMGKKQIEVPYKGEVYYGCCEMCVERIPKDETVRVATDPQTGEKVNKATAYIVLLNDEGSVAYFASEKNYQQFLAASK